MLICDCNWMLDVWQGAVAFFDSESPYRKGRKGSRKERKEDLGVERN
jgi:hypothetical protein